MQTEFARNLDLAQAKIQYDEQCKKVLGDKNILSWIMQRTVSEYAGMSRKEIMDCIEGEPEIGSRRVSPGETNATRITGLSNEDKVNEEGVIYYDIRFFAWLPSKEEKIRLIINVEAQKETEDAFLRMMKTLLDVEMPAKEKKERLQRDYEIQMENGLGKELSLMCNLSDAVEEKGIKKGIEQGIEKGKEIGKEEGKELGKLELLFSLVHDDVLSSKAAAERAGMPEKEFLELMSQKEK